ncbi:ABC transporter ATP-binding protein [Streptomonospora salina]|uniref:ABC-type multidrug transport system ATPase subunit n=1 Tax=Streptomonospora salina TaxID=104205 RepID=A0A841EDH9_9ACTN|nr:ABC transporter ATP-binding protein [Streptomonospora salina]MBB5998510.1 ABC-type multidrug transport system ATPase subunit [Streptomonospora salina]
MPSHDRPAVLFDDVVRAYSPAHAIGPVNLRADAGECVALVGANGSGKSTMLRVASGTDRPTAGSVSVLGAPPRPTDPEFRRAVFVLEELSYFPDLSVREHLELVAAGHGLGRGGDARISETLARCRLDAHARANPRTLSRGQRQLLAIASMLLPPQPRVFVLDEPESHLDGPARTWLGATLQRIKDEGGVVLLATHQSSLADRLADRTVELDEGEPRSGDGSRGDGGTGGE